MLVGPGLSQFIQNGIRRDVEPELCNRMTQIYTFIYRRLVDASINRDVAAADEGLRLLEYQRDTWAMLIEKIAEDRASDADPAEPPAPVDRGPEDGGSILSVEG